MRSALPYQILRCEFGALDEAPELKFFKNPRTKPEELLPPCDPTQLLKYKTKRLNLIRDRAHPHIERINIH